MFQSTPAHGGRPATCSPPVFSRIVSIHARTRRATWFSAYCKHIRPVSIHARTRRATAVKGFNRAAKGFQSTPAHGGRHFAVFGRVAFGMFQSTPAHGGRLSAWVVCRSSFQFQSTPAHGGRHKPLHGCMQHKQVSIHARTRRATMYDSRSENPLYVSIHARTRRATVRCVEPWRGTDVSIHARTRRATLLIIKKTELYKFQSTPAHGGRLELANEEGLKRVSIHARTRRATSAREYCRGATESFNPRPHTAGDVTPLKYYVSTLVSIHARTRRATGVPLFLWPPWRVSIHARTRRATCRI